MMSISSKSNSWSDLFILYKNGMCFC
jgi:hypothetical protein